MNETDVPTGEEVRVLRGWLRKVRGRIEGGLDAGWMWSRKRMVEKPASRT